MNKVTELLSNMLEEVRILNNETKKTRRVIGIVNFVNILTLIVLLIIIFKTIGGI